jgi:hypothetical protein
VGLSDAQIKESASVQEDDVEPRHVKENPESNPLYTNAPFICRETSFSTALSMFILQSAFKLLYVVYHFLQVEL